VFSPYYAAARGRAERADPEDHCALNVALYGDCGSRWTMTERGRRSVRRDRQQFVLGPSRVHWDGESIVVEIDEFGSPLPRRVRGRVRLSPQGLCSFVTGLDAAGRHRWGPIAPCARVEVCLEQPALTWSGHAYMDCNEGDEPLESAFREWDWSRAQLADGSTAVIYDVRPREGADRVIAERFQTDGRARAFTAPPRQAMPHSLWRIGRTMRSDPGVPPRVLQTLEDTPFYVRSTLRAGLLGQSVTAMHETLDLTRLASLPVRLMLPVRMPRRR
jgi:carotenoid 1,2-hydratase